MSNGVFDVKHILIDHKYRNFCNDRCNEKNKDREPLDVGSFFPGRNALSITTAESQARTGADFRCCPLVGGVSANIRPHSKNCEEEAGSGYFV